MEGRWKMTEERRGENGRVKGRGRRGRRAENGGKMVGEWREDGR